MLSMPGDAIATSGLVERMVEAEQAGFASAWLPQVGTVDALMALALGGRDTSTIELGTAVTPTYPRHPTVIAEQALTVQDATGNRLALGIGLSHKFLIEDSLGLDYSRPIPHTREYLTILNGLLAGEVVRHKGDEYNVKSQIKVGQATKPPVLVAALGPAMLRTCGRLADGTITWMGGIDYLRDVAIPTMSEAAAKAGRPAPRFVAMVPVLLTDDADSGRDTINETFKMYGQIPSYRATLDRGGAALPADVAVIGDQAAIEAGVQAFKDVGVTDFAIAVPPGTPTTEATKELLGELASR
ncbi:MAG: 5,10-methylenetetrahydromethanopterin reductase [Candidatus Poriferisodalaceae bacterium]|jgi:5,10-methylenetetrahydromethanopterin reductase